MHSAIVDADIIYTDCWPARGTDEEQQKIRELFLPYQVTEDILRISPQDALFLAMNWPGCRVYEAKEYLLHAQNALLVSLLNANRGFQEWLR